MKIVLAILLVAIIGAVAWLLIGNAMQRSGPQAPVQSSPTAGEKTDLTTSQEVTVKIRDLSYSPANIKIKKGTKVIWLNEDTMGHNVVADSATTTGGLPTSHPVFGRGEKFEHTFTQAGTFRYHCTPHTFMHGSVEVTE